MSLRPTLRATDTSLTKLSPAVLLTVCCSPPGGLTHGYFALQAALRYECVWLPTLRSRSLSGRCKQLQEAGGGAGGKGAEGVALVPPLDIAFAW